MVIGMKSITLEINIIKNNLKNSQNDKILNS